MCKRCSVVWVLNLEYFDCMEYLKLRLHQPVRSLPCKAFLTWQVTIRFTYCPSRTARRHSEGGTTVESPEDQPAPKQNRVWPFIAGDFSVVPPSKWRVSSSRRNDGVVSINNVVLRFLIADLWFMICLPASPMSFRRRHDWGISWVAACPLGKREYSHSK